MFTPTAMVAPHSPLLPDDAGLAAAKAALRARMRAARAGWDAAASGAAVAAHVLAHGGLPHCVAGFWPLAGELDMRPLWHALHRAGHCVVLPETPGKGMALIFRVWTPESVMIPERFGTLRPEGVPAAPDLVFAPLLAFDAQGGRLGYGGGFYDRTLAALGVPAVGLGFARQRVAAVPAGRFDRALDAVVTEDGLAAGAWPG